MTIPQSKNRLAPLLGPMLMCDRPDGTHYIVLVGPLGFDYLKFEGRQQVAKGPDGSEWVDMLADEVDSIASFTFAIARDATEGLAMAIMSMLVRWSSVAAH